VKHWWSVLVVGFLLAVPLILTCTWLYANDRWAPVLDLAVTELRVRDVGTAHTPLVGLFGRFGPMGNDQGSHPGPLSFYLLAPVYRLLGGSYWDRSRDNRGKLTELIRMSSFHERRFG
jgi:hypothetical protein